ncbi:MAG: hypothetical protein Q9169_008276, partial [Polycauliona sp. 2 TL-2023]
MASTTPQADTYMLSRTITGSTRLNAQHQLWQHELGHLLNPSIFPLPPNARIADLATGTGIWLLELSSQYPHLTYHGLDISISQTPPTAWLPPNLSFSAWDVRSAPPPSFHGTFDVVHIRLLSVALGDAVKGEEVVRNISMLLKPGGWLQWEEMDMTRSIVATADPSITPIAIPRMDQAMKTGSEKSLIPRLGNLLSAKGANGFVEVTKYEIEAKKELLKWSTEMHVLAFAEAAENWPAGGAIQVAMKELVTAVQKEAEIG